MKIARVAGLSWSVSREPRLRRLVVLVGRRPMDVVPHAIEIELQQHEPVVFDGDLSVSRSEFALGLDERSPVLGRCRRGHPDVGRDDDTVEVDIHQNEVLVDVDLDVAGLNRNR